MGQLAYSGILGGHLALHYQGMIAERVLLAQTNQEANMSDDYDTRHIGNRPAPTPPPSRPSPDIHVPVRPAPTPPSSPSSPPPTRKG